MIEEGGIYKLKKIKDFIGTNTEDDFKVLKISGDTVYCQNIETKELNMFNKKDFIDPDFPDDIYSDIEIVMEKLNTKMKPMNLSFWKELAEDLGGCVSASAASGGGMASLGTMPCPAMAQITGGSISGAMVNGVPVAGKSVKKKKKKKKHEEYEEESTYYMDSKEERVVSPDEMLDILEEGLLGKKEILYTMVENNRERIKVSVQYSFEPDDTVMMFKLNLDFLDEGDEVIDNLEETVTLVELIGYLTEIFLHHEETELVLENYVQSLIEDFNEDYEAITEQIAKYLDRLNFKFANTEDIIYKKEGDNKYLFKFDNEIGIIKIKVLHNDEVLIEKEYEIDETQDIQPIFDEIEKIYKEYGL